MGLTPTSRDGGELADVRLVHDDLENLDTRSLRLALATFVASVVVAGALFLWTLFTPPFYGDLTRIALLSESAFGWRASQPAVPDELRRSVRIADADILVIGDSFSVGLVWQSELMRAGWRVATVDWRDTGPLCSDFFNWLSLGGFRGRLVVIESVERELDLRLRESEGCSNMDRHRGSTARSAGQLPDEPPGGLNWSEKLLTGASVFMNTRRAERSNSDLIFDEGTEVRMQRVPDGCKRFSHVLCEKVLFLARDSEQPGLSPSLLGRMAAFNLRHTNVAVEWVVFPNKSSVYLESRRAQDVGASLAAMSLGPDLFGTLAASRLSVRDLYLPNDTHPSTRGYLLAGQHVAARLNSRLR